jgi:hypothetical protein
VKESLNDATVEAPSPTSPVDLPKKPLWKRRWFLITGGAVVALVIISNAAKGSTPEPTPPAAAVETPAAQEQPAETPAPAVETPAPVAETPAPVAAPEPAAPALTLGQTNAVLKAKSYLSLAGFSRDGLVEQLQFEGFSPEDSAYGADNAGADWNAEAAEKAKSYMDLSAFSASGLSDQLAFEGFTPEQVAAGLAAVGY